MDLSPACLNARNRACQECSRKKIKCDGERPICGLCLRMGFECNFPVRRKAAYKGGHSVPRSSRSSRLPSIPPIKANVNDTVDFGEQSSGWQIPSKVCLELIELFFQKVSCWLPILHHSRFFERYFYLQYTSLQIVARDKASDDAAYLIYNMFALTARFSASTTFKDIPPLERGDQFLKEAIAIKNKVMFSDDVPTIEVVQATVLLTSYYVAAGQLSLASIMTSVCLRLAYSIGLNEIDYEDSMNEYSSPDHSHEWSKKEELRRLWWAIWEFDQLVSTLSQQPRSINSSQVHVRLPVSDTAWYSGIPVYSPHLALGGPDIAWRVLLSSPNQSARAWCLVSLHLFTFVMGAQREPSIATIDYLTKLELSLSCFKLALPPIFYLDSLILTQNNFADGNWAISTHLLLMAAEIILEELKTESVVFNMSSSSLEVSMGSQLSRIAHAWTSDYISLCHPLTSCGLIGSRGTVVQNRMTDVWQRSEITQLLLTHFARKWKLGIVLLRLHDAFTKGSEALQFDFEDKHLAKHFLLFWPSHHRRKRRGLSMVTTQSNINDAQEFSQDIDLQTGQPDLSLSYESPLFFNNPLDDLSTQFIPDYSSQ